MLRRDEKGFTLIELLTAMTLTAILMTLGATSLRHYWLVHSLEAAADEAVTEFRRAQEATVSESHPVSFGVRVKENSSSWDLVRFDPGKTVGNRCTFMEREDFSGSLGATVEVSNVTVPGSSEATACRSDLLLSADDHFFFFYARGSATAGSVTLTQPAVGRSESVTVTGITGRVDRS